MSKETREFDIAVMDYSTASVRFYRRNLPKDIQTDELEEILDAEGLYKQSECYLMFRPTAEGGIKVEDNR
jgi:hypothetical protein